MASGIILAGTAALAAAATLAYATLSAQSQFFGPTLQAPPLPNQLALTFDDGPNPAATPQLLEVLARHNVRATFFVIGRFVALEPTLTRQIAAAGHAIGNHTMTHPFLPKCSSQRIQSELAGCNAVLEQTLGRPVALFRPPHGALRPAVLRTARSLNLQTVQWNLIAGDWNPTTPEALLAKLLTGIGRNRRRNRGTNIVLHDGGQAGLGQPRLPTVHAVDKLLTHLRQAAQPTDFVLPPDWASPS